MHTGLPIVILIVQIRVICLVSIIGASLSPTGPVVEGASRSGGSHRRAILEMLLRDGRELFSATARVMRCDRAAGAFLLAPGEWLRPSASCIRCVLSILEGTRAESNGLVGLVLRRRRLGTLQLSELRLHQLLGLSGSAAG